MKLKMLFLLSLSTAFVNAQGYFEGKRLYCPTNDKAKLETFDLAIRAMQHPKYLGASTNLFFDLIKKDSTFCDAYFFAGYTLSLQNRLSDALVYYYMADSLSNNKSLEFKINLAALALKIGDTVIPRRRYKQMVQYFPASPEGYFGIALTSVMIGDVEKGLKNIEKAISIYERSQSEISDDTELLYAILLTRNKKHEESLIHFENCKSSYIKLDDFNVHYSYSLLQVAKSKNDEKMKLKAKKLFEKVKDKSDILPEIKTEFQI